MSIQMVRFATEPEHRGTVQHAIGRLFAAIAEARPPGLTYTAFQVGDEPEFILVLELSDGTDNPLPQIPEAARFRQSIPSWAGAPIPPRTLNILERYQA